MVIRHLLLGAVILLFSCSFFLATPFPFELPDMQKLVSLDGVISVEGMKNPLYEMYYYKDFLFLSIREEWQSSGQGYLFDNELNFLGSSAGEFDNLHFEDISSDSVIIGNIQVDPFTLVFTELNDVSIDNYLVSYNSSSYLNLLRDSSDDMRYNYQFLNSSLMPSGDSGYITFQGSNFNRIVDVQVSPDGVHEGYTGLVVFYLEADDDRGEVALIPIERFQGTTVQNKTYEEFKDSVFRSFLFRGKDDIYHYTDSGIVTRQDNQYYLYHYDNTRESIDFGSSESRRYVDYYIHTPSYYFRIDTEKMILSKNSIWWQP